ncbi:MAG: hypothetical protein MI923_04770 [Phycisphaerales bacterium]|nr:hypothetical protein [Phycisphaerales bacterium]
MAKAADRLSHPFVIGHPAVKAGGHPENELVRRSMSKSPVQACLNGALIHVAFEHSGAGQKRVRAENPDSKGDLSEPGTTVGARPVQTGLPAIDRLVLIFDVCLFEPDRSPSDTRTYFFSGQNLNRIIDEDEARFTAIGGKVMKPFVLTLSACIVLSWFLPTSTADASVTTFEVRVNRSKDDAEEDGGTWNSKLELGQMDYVGFRFRNVNVPQGANITAAYVEMRAADSNSENTDLTIFGQDADTTSEFSGSSSISGRPKTSASVTWNNVPNWTSNQVYQTPELKTIIQEIVDRGGWSSGNSMVIMLRSDDLNGKRMVVSYDSGSGDDDDGGGGSATAPLLHIEYTPGPALMLSDHDAGQEPDAFTESGGETDAELYAFKLDPFSDTVTVTQLVFDLSNHAGLTDSDWNNVELVIDSNANGVISGGENSKVGGNGTVNHAAGTLTFTSNFNVSAPTHFILRADFSSLSDGDKFTVSLDTGGVSTTATRLGSTSAAMHAEGCFYIERFQTWSATSADTWQVMDLSGSPYNIPADAVLEVAVRNGYSSGERWGGVRAVGSSLNRRILLHEPESGGEDVMVMHVQADTNSQIEHYSDNTSSVDFVILGYWNCGTYREMYNSFKAGGSGSWQEIDLKSYIGTAEVTEFVIVNNNSSAEREVGLRTRGSSLERRLDLHEAESGGDDVASMIVVADSTTNATIEAYAESNTDIDFYLMGYWSDPPGTYTESFDTITSPTTDGTWQDKDLSGFNVPAHAVVDVTPMNQDTSEENYMGVREKGSSLGRTLDLQEPESGGGDFARFHATADANSTIQVYHQDVSDPHSFFLTGFWAPPSSQKKVIIWREIQNSAAPTP